MPNPMEWKIEKLPTQWLPEFNGLGRRININGQEADAFIRKWIAENGEGTFAIGVTIRIWQDD